MKNKFIFYFLQNLIVFHLVVMCSGQKLCRTPEGLQGICIPITECTEIMEIVNRAPKPLPDWVKRHIQNSLCGPVISRSICCPRNPNIITTTTTQQTPVTSATTTSGITVSNNPVDVTNHPNLKLLPINQCGPILEDKLSGGVRTELNEFPWMALLEYDGPGRFQCGGSLINDRYVLTAAHCIIGPRDPLVSVRLGEHVISTNTDCELLDDEQMCAPPIEDIPVESAIPHPLYSKTKFIHDIGLVRLSTRANLRKTNIKPICLPYSTKLVIKDKFILAGWGTTETSKSSDVLLKASVPIVSNDQCQVSHRRSLIINPQHMCAGGEAGIDSCKGDSGGPLIQPASLSGIRFVQYGIVSAGIAECGGPVTLPGIYTRVTHYMDWILDQLKD